MKKLFLLLLCLLSLNLFAQEEGKSSFKRNEIKGNALFLVLGTFEATYERLINEESGFGISLHVPFTNDSDINFSVTPYYRFYFGKKPAAGFFVEGFGMLNQVDDYIYDYNSNFEDKNETITDFAFGLGLGGKWITNRGVIFEINAGVGRNLFSEYNENRDYEFIGRGGITVGYRF
ncbi:DUF3575 domain-containing protein [Flavobacterium sp.]|uniref:DUF3575 domain-containing protein n=1 Tax=Flavobacterium sp. TaxID=239 RepID=UPI002615E920|nr:DUF3575 domain-containing protein [Flavobacterium sp.]MDD2984779.1 DUF3575 domain-containing protein [Flavobacterium sp.]